MNKEDHIFILVLVMYVFGAIMVMDYMGHLTHDIKVQIFKHYNVPLKDDQ